MSRFKRLHVLNTLIETGIVPLYYNKDAALVKQVVKACYKGGARVFEFTNRGDFAHEVFAEVNKWAETECPEMIMGVGSVIDAGTCSLYMQLGANFIVSPLLNPEMAKACNRRKVAWMPGCGSVSEVNYAEELGAEIIKIFPGKEVGGPAFVKSVLGPMPWSMIMPSGGVSPDYENLKSWFEAGASCVGMGSKLINDCIIKSNDFETLEIKMNQAIKIINDLKSNM